MNYTEIEMEWMKEILRDKEEEIWTLKANVEFLHSCLDDRDKSIELMKEENIKLKEENEKLEEDNINLISFNEHYSPNVIVKYEDRYEIAYKEELIENAKLCDKMRRLEEENKSLREENKRLSDFLECEA